MSELSFPYSLNWPSARPGDLPLPGSEFQLWWVTPEVSVPGKLTKQESTEANARPDGPVLEQWRKTRRSVRGILAGITGTDPAAIRIERSAFGKPYLPNSDLHFSISHSGEHIVVAVGRRPVGVDVEIFGRERLSIEVADRYFPAAEARWIRSLTSDQAAANFLRLWVSKEAALKCLGTGLAGYLERTICQRTTAGNISTVQVDGQEFAIREFELDGLGRGALAVEGDLAEVTLLRAIFPPDSGAPI